MHQHECALNVLNPILFQADLSKAHPSPEAQGIDVAFVRREVDVACARGHCSFLHRLKERPSQSTPANLRRKYELADVPCSFTREVLDNIGCAQKFVVLRSQSEYKLLLYRDPRR